MKFRRLISFALSASVCIAAFSGAAVSYAENANTAALFSGQTAAPSRENGTANGVTYTQTTNGDTVTVTQTRASLNGHSESSDGTWTYIGVIDITRDLSSVTVKLENTGKTGTTTGSNIAVYKSSLTFEDQSTGRISASSYNSIYDNNIFGGYTTDTTRTINALPDIKAYAETNSVDTVYLYSWVADETAGCNITVTSVYESKDYEKTEYTMDNKTELTYSGISANEEGMHNNAVNFDGGYASLPKSFIGDAFTFSAWINPSSAAQWERIFDCGSGTSVYAFLTVNCDSGLPRFAVKDGGTEQYITSSVPVSAGIWYYITVAFDNGYARLYINGSLAASGAITSDMSKAAAGTNNYIGKSQFSADPSYKGLIDEIYIYNYALTADEIKSDMRATMQAVSSIDSENITKTVRMGSAVTLPSTVGVIFENGLIGRTEVVWTNLPDGKTEGEYTVNGTVNLYGESKSITATVTVVSDSKDENYSITANINYMKNSGISRADAVYAITAKDSAGDDDLTITLSAYDSENALIGNEVTKVLEAADVKNLNGDFAAVSLDLDTIGEITLKSTLKKGETIIAEAERVVNNEPSFADTSDIELKPDSRLDESERVGLGYIMGIDLPRLIAPSYEIHGLTLTYDAEDEAVKNGDKKAGDTVKRYGGWEAKGAWKTNSDSRYTLAGEQMGHWLSAAAVFYNDLKNEKSIEITAESQNGSDTSDTAPSLKSDTTITPQDIHDKMEYVIDKLDELQNTDIPSGCTTASNKEYIGGCDETPFLNCFAGSGSWLGNYWVPWYNIHKVYQGLLDVCDYAEPELALKAYKVLKKLADWAVTGTSSLTDSQMQSVLNIEYGGMNEIFARMYEITGDEVYKSAARRFTHDSVIDPLKTNNTASLSGLHANTQIPKFIGAAELYEQDSEAYSDYKDACVNFWNNVVNERSYAIGGNSLSEHFQTAGTEELGVKTCESCNTYNMMRLTEHLFTWEHNSKYMDWYERALYNHVLGQQDPVTGAKMYFVSMVQGTHRIYEQKYNSWWCCTGTGMENPGRYTRTAYFEDDSDLYVNLYMPGTYTWESKGLTFDVDTDYPYSEDIKISVSGASGSGNIKFRAPEWVKDSGKSMTVKVNGVEKAVSDGGEYVTVNDIKNGDVIELTIPMGISLYESRDNQKVVYEYGPMVLAAKLDGTIKPSYEYIWEERNTACQQVAYPILKTTDGKGISTSDDLTEYVTKNNGDGTLTFTLAADKNTTGRDIELVPFTDISHSYHNVYFDIDKSIDDYAINLSNVQLDYVDPDGQQSELGHGMAQSSEETTEFRSRSVQGMDSNGSYRYAYGADGFFKYNMLVDKSSDKNYLILRYYDGDETVTAGGKTYNVKFKIFVDDNELMIDGNNFIEVKDGSNQFVNKLIEIPNDIISASTLTDASTGYNLVTVKLVPYDDNSATVPYRRLYTTTGDPDNMSGAKNTAEYTVNDSSISVKLSFTGTVPQNDEIFIYAAFKKEGILKQVIMRNANEDLTADIPIPEGTGGCDITLYVWDKNMKPYMDAVPVD